MVDPGAPSNPKFPRPARLHRKCRTRNRDTGWLPPKPTVVPLEWLRKPELPLSAEERKLAPPQPEAPINGRKLFNWHRTSLMDVPSIPPSATGHARERDIAQAAAKEEADRIASRDQAIVAAGYVGRMESPETHHDHPLGP